MKKPIWLRLLGWVDAVLWLFWFVFMFEIEQGHTGATYGFAALVFGAPAFCLGFAWAIMSTILWGMNRQVKVGAAVMRDAVGRAMKVPSPRTHRQNMKVATPSWNGKAPVPSCSYCAGPSVLHCRCHEASLCWEHLLTHDSDECAYIRAERTVR